MPDSFWLIWSPNLHFYLFLSFWTLCDFENMNIQKPVLLIFSFFFLSLPSCSVRRGSLLTPYPEDKPMWSQLRACVHYFCLSKQLSTSLVSRACSTRVTRCQTVYYDVSWCAECVRVHYSTVRLCTWRSVHEWRKHLIRRKKGSRGSAWSEEKKRR